MGRTTSPPSASVKPTLSATEQPSRGLSWDRRLTQHDVVDVGADGAGAGAGGARVHAEVDDGRGEAGAVGGGEEEGADGELHFF